MSKQPSSRNLTALNWLNFFAADISDGVGPFLAVYLATNLKWNSGDIGMAIAATTFAMVVGQAPAGYIVDIIRQKRYPIIVASLVVGATALLLPSLRSFPVLLACQVIIGLAASFYMPTLVALASVVSEKAGFDHVISKNQSFNHAGNVAAAVFTGVVARFTNNAGIFYCMMALAVLCTVSALSISQKAAAPEEPSQSLENQKGLFKDVIGNRAFLMFLLLTIIFYFSNGAMLPLVGQEIAKARPENSTLYLAACIIIAQLVMVPTVFICGKLAQKGRKKLLVAAFILLAARGILYTITDNVVHLLAFQILDGMAAGTFSVVAIMVVNDLMGTSGRASFAQGMLAASLSFGSTLSNLAAGLIVDAAGFRMGFMFLSALALGALVLLWKAMPETLNTQSSVSVTPAI
ncbi:MFS transporter [Dyadobacter flavalbus]|uniref:MFS transporter n=1 Tax=Dyadobacter flavalbus TaxID=2579942 RepID=A0A5M8QPZ3_9BACT|nr:MFS transporter [Dyadobacter flavalbus]KAA6438297.1 MFS transporter [Dyadobacter flavalbus]